MSPAWLCQARARGPVGSWTRVIVSHHATRANALYRCLSAAAYLVAVVEESPAVGQRWGLGRPSHLAQHCLWRTCIAHTQGHTVPEGPALRQCSWWRAGLWSALERRLSAAAH